MVELNPFKKWTNKTKYRAYLKLKRLGKTPKEIAQLTGISLRQVKQLDEAHEMLEVAQDW